MGYETLTSHKYNSVDDMEHTTIVITNVIRTNKMQIFILII